MSQRKKVYKYSVNSGNTNLSLVNTKLFDKYKDAVTFSIELTSKKIAWNLCRLIDKGPFNPVDVELINQNLNIN